MVSTNMPKVEVQTWRQVVEGARLLLHASVPYLDHEVESLSFVPRPGMGSNFACDRGRRIDFDPVWMTTMGPKVIAWDILHEVVVHLLPDHFTRWDESGLEPKERPRMNLAGDLSGNMVCAHIAAKSNGRLLPMGKPIVVGHEAEGMKAAGLPVAASHGFKENLTMEEYYLLLKSKNEGGGGCGVCMDDSLAEAAAAAGARVPKARTAIEQESIRAQTAAAIAAFPGDMPAGLKLLATLITTPPKVDWRKELRAAVAHGAGSTRGMTDYTMRRAHKRSAVILRPSMFTPEPKYAVVLDTSGSMGRADISNALSEIRGILTKGGVKEAFIIPCDTVAAKPAVIKSVQQANDKLVGGGGTDMGAGLLAAAKVRATLTIVVTDGDTGWPATPPRCGKIIICLVRKPHCALPPWGNVVRAYDT